MDFFTTSGVAKLFEVTDQTVKNWAREFATYLSPTATPGDGKRRQYTSDDLEVFALVHAYKGQGLGYEDAHAALRTGQRGDVPDERAQALATAPPPQLLDKLRDEIALRDRLVDSLKSDRDKERGKVELLEKQLEQKDKTIRELIEEIAVMKASKPKA